MVSAAGATRVVLAECGAHMRALAHRATAAGMGIASLVAAGIAEGLRGERFECDSEQSGDSSRGWAWP